MKGKRVSWSEYKSENRVRVSVNDDNLNKSNGRSNESKQRHIVGCRLDESKSTIRPSYRCFRLAVELSSSSSVAVGGEDGWSGSDDDDDDDDDDKVVVLGRMFEEAAAAWRLPRFPFAMLLGGGDWLIVLSVQ